MIASPPIPIRQEAASHGKWGLDRLSACAEIGRILDKVCCAMAGHKYESKESFAVCLALEEALANAVKHGHRKDPGQFVRIRVLVEPDRVLIMVKDRGKGFDPNAVPDPRAPENLDRPTGRGLLLMRTYTTLVRFNARGNCVFMGKRRLGSPAPPPPSRRGRLSVPAR